MNTNKINEDINRIRLMMSYNSSRTLNENYNSLSKIVINEQGKAVVDTIFKDLAKTASRAEMKTGIETAIKDWGGIGIQTEKGLYYASKDVDEIIKAMEKGTISSAAEAGKLAKSLFQRGGSIEVKAASADAITSTKGFANKYGGMTKEQMVETLKSGPGYSQAEAEMLANRYMKNVEKSGTETAVKDITKTGEKAGAEEIGATVKTGEKTGAKQPKKPKTKSGKEIESLTDDEIKGMSKSESEQIMKETEDFYKQADENVLKSERARAERKALETERELLANKKLAAEEAKALAKESPSKFKLWAKTKGLLRWTYRWTIGNKWFWILGGGTIAGYWLWNNWFKDNGIGITEDPGIDIPSTDGGTTVDIGGGGTSQEKIDAFKNDPNSYDGGSNDPLKGKYRNCGKGPFKLGCATKTTDEEGDLIGNLQSDLGLEPTGFWGYKTNDAVLDREYTDSLSIDIMRNK